MKDYWNDPPEEPELPVCCEDFIEVFKDGSGICPTCGKRFDPPPSTDEYTIPYDTIEERDSEKEQFPYEEDEKVYCVSYGHMHLKITNIEK